MGQAPKLLFVCNRGKHREVFGNHFESRPGGALTRNYIFAADTNSYTLSRQSENIASVGVELGRVKPRSC